MKLEDFSVVGFSGSRSIVPDCLEGVCKKIDNQKIFVGDAKGVDAAVRDFFPDAVVFKVKFPKKGGFAERSIRFVDAIASNQGCLISFPNKACPVGLIPANKSKAFNGSGSGSWATLSYAVWSNVACFVYLGKIKPPSWLSPLGSGWFCYRRVVQLSLF